MIARGTHRGGKRSGVASLIEVLAAMTIIAVLFGTTASLTALMFRLERTGQDDLAATITGGTLAADFRADGHAASGVEEGEDAEQIVLTGPGDRRTVYRRDGRSLIREGGGPGEAGRRESYRLRPRATVRWEVREAGAWRVVTLAIEETGEVGGDRRVVRIDATIGRDHRYGGDDS
ncbi:hypothetical protein AB1L88_18650 [Tautonia sp. JC769]|uniref:hypothetical protein n=1 Tax=Tautonia sp. JC769 TaxID=3232135 RepID=UPI003457AB17